MDVSTTRASARRGLLTITACAALLVGLSGPAIGSGSVTLPTAAVPAAAFDGDDELLMDAKFAAVAEVGLDPFDVPMSSTPCNFVIAIWQRVDPAKHQEVRAAAETAFSSGSATGSDADCVYFITTEIFAANQRDSERQIREAEDRRASNAARRAAAAAIGVIADENLLSVSDQDFAYRIFQLADDSNWPKAKAAAATAFGGTPEQQRAFIASGLIDAAAEDKVDRINRDEAASEEERLRQLARAAKERAANRVGMPVTETLLDLPDRDFLIAVWDNTEDGTEVQSGAIAAVRSLDPAVWKAYIETGILLARDRDIAKALAEREARDRTLLTELRQRAEDTGNRPMSAAAAHALAGDATAVDEFLRNGQHEVRNELPDLVQFLDSKLCLSVTGSSKSHGARVVQWPCVGNARADSWWKLIQRPGYTEVRNVNSGRCLMVGTSNPRADGEVILQATCNGSAGQQWRLQSTPGYPTRLRSFLSDKCATVDGIATIGAFIRQQPCSVTTKGQHLAFHARGLQDLTAGRFNDDAYEDLAAVDIATGTLWLYPGTAAGISFGARTRFAGGNWNTVTKLDAGEFTGDAFDDVIAVEPSTGRLNLYPGGADGKLQTRIHIASTWNDRSELTVGDFNGDGRADLMAMETSGGRLLFYPGTGDNSVTATGATRAFRSPVVLASGWGGKSKFGAGDFTRDGLVDLTVVENDTAALYVYPGRGNGTFGARVRVGDKGWNGMTGIVNGAFTRDDDLPDLLAVENSTGKLFRWPGLEAGLFGNDRSPIGIGD